MPYSGRYVEPTLRPQHGGLPDNMPFSGRYVEPTVRPQHGGLSDNMPYSGRFVEPTVRPRHGGLPDNMPYSGRYASQHPKYYPWTWPDIVIVKWNKALVTGWLLNFVIMDICSCFGCLVQFYCGSGSEKIEEFVNMDISLCFGYLFILVVFRTLTTEWVSTRPEMRCLLVLCCCKILYVSCITVYTESLAYRNGFFHVVIWLSC
jgi:hypothetical protein